jgi:RsiW-degrading membrane proteinase PrsW (M82 family)
MSEFCAFGKKRGEKMWETILVSFAVLVVFLFLWIVFYKKQTPENKPAAFVCSECGDRHCNCYKEDEISSK